MTSIAFLLQTHRYNLLAFNDHCCTVMGAVQVYLSAVQVQILVANLQLQNLHLVVPLLYYRGVPHWAPIQSWFGPSHDLRKEQKNTSLINCDHNNTVNIQQEHALAKVYPSIFWQNTYCTHTHKHPAILSICLYQWVTWWRRSERGTEAVRITVTDLLSAGYYLSLISSTLTRLGLQWRNHIGKEDTRYYVSKMHSAAMSDPLVKDFILSEKRSAQPHPSPLWVKHIADTAHVK